MAVLSLTDVDQNAVSDNRDPTSRSIGERCRYPRRRFLKTTLELQHGPTLEPITTPISDQQSCSTGFIVTTGTGHMVA
jgi:hypothetical protein